MEVKLVVIGGGNAGQAVPVAGPKFFIGRSEECQLRPNSDLVSRHHCAIMVDEGLVTVRDFGSRNGTFVNGERIRGEEELKAGDKLTVGPLEFEVQIGVSLGGAKKSKVHNVEEAAARTVESAKALAAAGDKGELDISDWLVAAEADTTHDTRPIDTVDKGTLTLGADQTNHWAPPETPPPEEPEKKKEKDPKAKTPGRLPGMKKPKAVNSQTAAEDVLRHFFHRR